MLFLLLFPGSPFGLPGQRADSARRIVIPGDALDEIARLRYLVDSSAEGSGLLRSATMTAAADEGQGVRWAPLLPVMQLRWNTPLPYGGNDGPLRAGRGHNVLVTAGTQVRYGRVTLVIAPQLVHEENRQFFAIPWDQARSERRSVWAHPYLPSPQSADWPIRFGTRPRTQVLTGQSRLALDLARHARLGISTENRWWGPGRFNALLLSSNAPGVPHVFLETPTPWRTHRGSFEGQYLLGASRESPFFDHDPSNDRRALTAAAITWRPPDRWQMLPTIGVARAVMAPGQPGIDDLLGVLRDIGRPISDSADIRRRGGRDQITEIFLRWRVPQSGIEAYAEWARYEFPSSVADFLAFPGHTQGYTVGFQVASPSRGSSTLHLQSEFTYAEPSTSLRVRPTGLSYTSPALPQGWTHEGQMLGPAIGPGASSQHLALDWHVDTRRVGVVLGRIRWLNGPVYTAVVPNKGRLSDVSLNATLRAAFAWKGMGTQVELTRGVRLAYMNLTYLRDPVRGSYEGWDFRTWSLGMTLTPADGAFFFRR